MKTTPSVIIIGQPDWYEEAERILIAAGFSVKPYQERAGYVNRLVDDHPALILVAGADTDWSFWVATPKASPATRRIPIIFISQDHMQHSTARRSGADVCISSDLLGIELAVLAHKVARVPDEAARAAMREGCNAPLPAEAVEAIDMFNTGQYYAQHDVFEALWMAEDSPVRDLYRAVLQVGVAYYQITRGNKRGALKMLLRSAQWLAILPDTCQTVDIQQLRADASTVRDALEALPDDTDLNQSFDMSLLKPVIVNK